jgi:hypothetical protein
LKYVPSLKQVQSFIDGRALVRPKGESDEEASLPYAVFDAGVIPGLKFNVTINGTTAVPLRRKTK